MSIVYVSFKWKMNKFKVTNHQLEGDINALWGSHQAEGTKEVGVKIPLRHSIVISVNEPRGGCV